ncbi:hypothetical protein CKA32_003131 [Geitlerinema sp. FC II]|nr:hypothetical protein CKA32_003131 [Geitlerinema sp. FC II]
MPEWKKTTSLEQKRDAPMEGETYRVSKYTYCLNCIDLMGIRNSHPTTINTLLK